MLDRIKEETKEDASQFGGVKKCGVDHFLVDTYDMIHRGLEDHRATINLISIDYAKAFNRMSHQAYLSAYKKKGASTNTLRVIASFLGGRSMRVKVRNVLSEKFPINGGSPQGCLSANALFCATIEHLQDREIKNEDGTANIGRDEPKEESSLYVGNTILDDIPSGEESVPFDQNGWEVPFSSPTDHQLPVGSLLLRSSPQSSITFSPPTASSFIEDSGDESPISRPLQGVNQQRRWEDTRSSNELPDQSVMRDLISFPDGWTDHPFWLNKYIDDGLGGEILCNSLATSHFTEKKEKKLIHAGKSQKFLNLTIQNANKIGMKINASKTKMMAIMNARNSHINTYITVEGEKIVETDELKILGYVFSRDGSAANHLRHIEKKVLRKTLDTKAPERSSGIKC